MTTKGDNYILSTENKQCIISNNYINKNDKENLINFFSTLGKSDLNGQLLNCKSYKDIFKRNLEKLKKNELNECKSIGTLIIGTGVLMVILMY